MNHRLCAFIMVLYCFFADAKVLRVHFFQNDVRYIYRTRLLELALQKTVDRYGDYKLVAVDTNATQARGLLYLETGKIDIASLPTTKEREKKFIPVKIPILRGILGYRVFLIRKADQTKFEKIATLDQLKKERTAGFCNQWADMEILNSNRIPTLSVATYDNLFEMLYSKRFDYFPRGINEAWAEIEKTASKYPDLTVEDNLAFYYPYPVYFFVNKKNPVLAERIETGLNLALKDGSFKKLFLDHHKYLIKQAGLNKRRIFILKNPLLPENTPLPDTSWWLPK